MARAIVTAGSVIGLSLAVPIIGGMMPSEAESKGTWAPLSREEFEELNLATQTPVRLLFTYSVQDAYLAPTAEHEYVWGIKADPAEFVRERADLFRDGRPVLPYAPINMGLAIFSPLCPHLGGRYNWIPDARIFRCPLHGSTFNFCGAHLGGPAPRGLDPLPLQERDGLAEIMWIRYRATTPDHIVVSYQA